VELYARVRRAVAVNKMSEREATKQFGLARETVRKMLRYSVPPGYRRQQPARRPKLDRWTGAIDQILEQDKAEGKKQRHTAKRIFERLRDEHAYTGGYTIVKDYVRLRKRHLPSQQPPWTIPISADKGDLRLVAPSRSILSLESWCTISNNCQNCGFFATKCIVQFYTEGLLRVCQVAQFRGFLG
jgi:transposase